MCTRTRCHASSWHSLAAARPSLHEGPCSQQARAPARPLRLRVSALLPQASSAGLVPGPEGTLRVGAGGTPPTHQSPGSFPIGPQPRLLYARQASVVTWWVGQGVSLSYPLQTMAMTAPEEGENGEPSPAPTSSYSISLSTRMLPKLRGLRAVPGGGWTARPRVRGDRDPICLLGLESLAF